MIKKLLNVLPMLGLVLVFGCEKDILNEDVPPAPPFNPDWGLGDSIPLVTDIYFTGKVDSMVYVFQDSITDYFNTMDSLTTWPCDTSSDMFVMSSTFADTSVSNSNGAGPSIEIQFLKCQPDTATLADELSVFSPITYPFGSSELNKLTEGVVVKWTARDGTVYTSRRGTGANQNFSFNILTIDTLSTTDTTATLALFGQMDLIVYNSTVGIPIESAQFRMKFGIKD